MGSHGWRGKKGLESRVSMGAKANMKASVSMKGLKGPNVEWSVNVFGHGF